MKGAGLLIGAFFLGPTPNWAAFQRVLPLRRELKNNAPMPAINNKPESGSGATIGSLAEMPPYSTMYDQG
ncbi:MAG: hypothetical protein ABJM43_13260 [Paracoccaceae bacterium]